MYRSFVGCGAIVAWIVFVHLATAAEFNEVLNIGDVGPAWVDLPGVDGKQHSLRDLSGKQIVVVVFTCNSCPVAADYEDRLIRFAKNHAGADSPVALVAINVNKIPEDLLPKMKERTKAKGFPFPYLYDESQKIAKDYGALFTPQFFVLDMNRKVVYMGKMDDNTDVAKAKVNYVELAVEAALKGGKPEIQETLGVGCRIRFARERK